MIKHIQNEDQNSPSHSQPQQSFAKEIQKVQIQRINLMKIIFKQKQQLKQNYQYYLNKKCIAPSSLNSLNSSSIEPNTFHLNLKRKPQSLQLIDQHLSPQKETTHNRNIQTAEQIRKRKSPKKLSDQTQVQKWKLEMTSEQKNCFLYGKQLKIGSKLRKILIGDEEINKLKKNILFRTKKKTQICLQQRPKKFKQQQFLKTKKKSKSSQNQFTQISQKF